MKKVFTTMAGVGFLLIFPSSLYASLVTVDADRYSIGRDLTHVFDGITLTVTGRPSTTVIALDGFDIFNGRNIATTGKNVFGYAPVLNPIPSGKVWDQNTYGLLRVDLYKPTNFIQIDLIFDDDDTGSIWAYDKYDHLLDSMSASGDGRGPIPNASVSISRSSPDIAYVFAGGNHAEGLFLDNLKYNQITEVIIPSPLILLGSGLVVLGLLSRRMRQASRL